LPFDFDVGLIDSVGVIGWPEVRAASFLQFRRIGLNESGRSSCDLQTGRAHSSFLRDLDSSDCNANTSAHRGE
jgi:hypothetical protein